MNDDALTTNPALNASRNFRAERQAKDSGEWHPVPLQFKLLPRPTQKSRAHRRARFVVASAVAVGCHLAFLAWSLESVNDRLPALLLLPIPGTLLGLAWMAQFQRLQRETAMIASMVWVILLAASSPLVGVFGVAASVFLIVPWTILALTGAAAARWALGARR